LEERGYGDVTTLTVQEYLNLSWWGRLRYRVYRNPIVMLVIGPWFLALKQRLPTFGNTNGKEIRNVIATNATLIGIFVLAGVLGALDKAALIYIPVFTLGGAAGVWLFYVQHQFEEAYWRPKGDWDYATAALYGSTYLKMPKVLQWFTGNIGLHHIHHLSPRIPNYRLQRCYDENPVFHDVPTLTLGSSFKTFGLRLWDEDAQRLVGFGHLRELKRQQRRAARAQAQAAA
jgi:omega-6 fatty acid desaturase (delta-12 desaturase)